MIYNDPVTYTDLILNDDPEKYLKTAFAYGIIFYLFVNKLHFRVITCWFPEELVL